MRSSLHQWLFTSSPIISSRSLSRSVALRKPERRDLQASIKVEISLILERFGGCVPRNVQVTGMPSCSQKALISCKLSQVFDRTAISDHLKFSLKRGHSIEFGNKRSSLMGCVRNIDDLDPASGNRIQFSPTFLRAAGCFRRRVYSNGMPGFHAIFIIDDNALAAAMMFRVDL